MASAAGGTSQRLNPGPAMVRSRARKSGGGRTSVVDIRPVLSMYRCAAASCSKASQSSEPQPGVGTDQGRGRSLDVALHFAVRRVTDSAQVQAGDVPNAAQ